MSTLMERYLMYREMQVGINSQVLKDHVDKDRLLAAASLLGIRKGEKTIEIDEDDMPILYDFSIHDVRRDGRTAFQNYVDAAGGVEGEADPVRRRLLSAMLSAKTSLYRADRARPAAGTVALVDMLGGGGRGGGVVTIHDRNLSRSPISGLGLFTRIISPPEVSMTGGASAMFVPGSVRRAASAYRRLAKKSDRRPEIKRFGLIFRLYQRYGEASVRVDARTGMP